ncbi:hypothetical protein PGTUg99_012564 [Puccinia graminis f. sp. tritici]|uniref:Uncharacterized protein n=1 Tax=Puccinia graminis f. sp. tritici TaxID=56615 RepID=A0A5B0S092_PUCGR|nr:hypothetical protein PGTUg99_012564 [Puccinia graminis f. sp. tritici]
MPCHFDPSFIEVIETFTVLLPPPLLHNSDLAHQLRNVSAIGTLDREAIEEPFLPPPHRYSHDRGTPRSGLIFPFDNVMIYHTKNKQLVRAYYSKPASTPLSNSGQTENLTFLLLLKRLHNPHWVRSIISYHTRHYKTPQHSSTRPSTTRYPEYDPQKFPRTIMSVVRAPNHPATFNGHFQPIADYGYVKTSSFFQCGGINCEKNKDFEVELVTNTALNNTLTADSIYSLSGKLIALNDGSTPILSYFQDTVVRIGPIGEAQPDFTNKSTVTSLGMVTSRREVASNASDSGSHLEVIVAHCDWDGQERVHRRFNIKYIVPGTKNLVKTHTLYQVGREINIIGRLVDFHMEDHMAVVVVSSVSVTSGHQIGRPNPSNTTASSSSPIQGRKFGPSTPQAHKQIIPMQSPQGAPSKTQRGSTPDQSAKGKSKLMSDSDTDIDEPSDNDGSEPSEADVHNSPPTQTKRGRPRKNIIKDAAKRMRKH